MYVCVCVCVCVGSRWPKGDMWYTHCYASSNKHQWFSCTKKEKGGRGQSRESIKETYGEANASFKSSVSCVSAYTRSTTPLPQKFLEPQKESLFLCTSTSIANTPKYK